MEFECKITQLGKPQFEIEQEWDCFLMLLEKVRFLNESDYVDLLEIYAIDQREQLEILNSLDFKKLLAILQNESLNQKKEEIESLKREIAMIAEKDIDKDERDMFVCMFIMEVKRDYKQILQTIKSIEIVKKSTIVISDEEIDTLEKISKKKPNHEAELTYIITSSASLSVKSSKKKITNRQKIRNQILQKRSFLLYNKDISIPQTGIKRIAVKEPFDEIVAFVQQELVNIHDGELVLEEKGKAKVMFKKVNKVKKKERNVKRIKIAS